MARGDVFVYTVVPAAEQLRSTVMIRVMSAVRGVKEAFVITKKDKCQNSQFINRKETQKARTLGLFVLYY